MAAEAPAEEGLLNLHEAGLAFFDCATGGGYVFDAFRGCDGPVLLRFPLRPDSRLAARRETMRLDV